MVNGAVSAEDGGAIAVTRHSGEQSEGSEEDEGVADHQVPARIFSGEGGNTGCPHSESGDNIHKVRRAPANRAVLHSNVKPQTVYP